MKPFSFFLSVVRIILPVIFLVSAQLASAQSPPMVPDTSRMSYNQISQACKIYVFPAKGQSQQKQKNDEYECYYWAMEQSGIDPLNLPKVEAEVYTGPTGNAIKGAAKGAAAGAAIGAISGDAGKGAAIGATAGAFAGRFAGKQAQAQQNQQAQASAAQAEQEMKNSFIKAFSVCMEGKGYNVK